MNHNSIEINFFFAICGLPIILAITLYTGEIWFLFQENSVKFYVCVCLSGLMGIVITCACLMVCTICNPVAFNITGIHLTINLPSFRKPERHSVDLRWIYIFRWHYSNNDGRNRSALEFYRSSSICIRMLLQRKTKKQWCQKRKQNSLILKF